LTLKENHPVSLNTWGSRVFFLFDYSRKEENHAENSSENLNCVKIEEKFELHLHAFFLKNDLEYTL
jgi:hypothetical protein